jgi:hypothetical protein
VPGPVHFRQVAVDEAYAVAQGVEHGFDGVQRVLDGPVAGVAGGHPGQPGPGEQSAVDYGRRQPGRARLVEQRRHGLPCERIGVVEPERVIEDPIGAGHIAGEGEYAVRAGQRTGAEAHQAGRCGGREAARDRAAARIDQSGQCGGIDTGVQLMPAEPVDHQHDDLAHAVQLFLEPQRIPRVRQAHGGQDAGDDVAQPAVGVTRRYLLQPVHQARASRCNCVAMSR